MPTRPGSALARKANLLAAWNLDSGRFVPVATDVLDTATVLHGGRYVVETMRSAYRFDNMFDRAKQDLVLIDASNGEKRSIASGVQYGVGGSATGRYVLYFKGGHHHAYDVETSTTVNLTGDIPASFINEEYDTPVREENPPWGTGGWLEDDSWVLLYDRYDI